MGVSISYQTQENMIPETRSAILVDLAKLTYPFGQPWCEPVGFFASETSQLQGAHKLFRMYTDPSDGRQQQIEFPDDSLMAGIDLSFILTWLHRIAERHVLTWSLELDGYPLGTITPDGIGGELAAMPAEFMALGGADTLSDAMALAPAIRAKYGIA